MARILPQSRTRWTGPERYIIHAMGRGLIALIVVVVVLGGLVAWAVSINNQLVVQEQNVNATWAQVQNQYQRRADLIPNLVETVKGFAQQERGVLEAVTNARARASGIQLTPEALNDPQAMKRFQDAQQQLGGALSRLLVTVERYPELKSNQNFLALQSQLEGTENRIAVERKRFNDAVQAYNTRLRLFPGSIIARLIGYTPKAFFEAAPDAATPPRVKF
jgi:LemA protein